jgi:hypothetical protein
VRQTRDERLHPVENCWPLTDDEWAIVEKIVASGGLLTRGGQRTKFDARQIIDGIVIKIGTGMSWVELDREELQSGAYKSIYSLIKDDGRWDRIAEFLAKSGRRELQLDELPLWSESSSSTNLPQIAEDMPKWASMQVCVISDRRSTAGWKKCSLRAFPKF